MFLQLLVGMLRTIPEIQLAAVARNVREASEVCRSLPVDLLILDLALPDGYGLDILRDLVERRPDVDCIVLSSAIADFSCPEPLLRHVRGTIDKTETYEQLAAVIGTVIRDRGVSLRSGRPSEGDPRRLLRPRELQVFQLIGQGFKTEEISRLLGISRNTVETHRKNIAARIKASGAELVRIAAIHNQTAIPQDDAR